MLVLVRKLGESVVIGDDIHIRILGIKGNQVRVGVEAPKGISVHRDEIYQKIQDEKENKKHNNQWFEFMPSDAKPD